MPVYKPYYVWIPIPAEKEAEMDKILQWLRFCKIEIKNKTREKIVLDKWGGAEIKVDALVYLGEIILPDMNLENYIMENRAIIGDLSRALVQNGILSISQMKLLSILNGWGLEEKIATDVNNKIGKIGLKNS